MQRALLIVCLLISTVEAGHRVILQGGTRGKQRLVILNEDGKTEWEKKWGGIHDIHVLPNGNIMVQRMPSTVVEIDPKADKVVWSYDAAKSNGNEGKRIEVHAFQPLADGTVMIAESGSARIIEVNRDGKLLKEIKLVVNKPHHHTDTRLARKLTNGNYLVCHEGDGAVREYNAEGHIVWEFVVPMFGEKAKGGHGPEAFGNKCFSAVRLKNGNTLIGTGNGHSVIEVDHHKKVVWKVAQNDLPGIRLAWVTTVEVLPNGNYMIGNCHAGPGQPLLVEVEPKTKKVVWKLDRFEDFGNSVSNSQVLAAKPTLR
ncbi:MAG: PQQ-binding-like beta-propeller repeat protein [Planctomycetaceae bacterium]